MNFDAKTKQLTRAELHLMNILWEKGQATVNELQAELPEPRPAYTTTLTVMQVLTRKGIVTFDKQGKTNIYRPLMQREEYVRGFLDETRNTLFKGSLSAFLTFFAKHEKISRSEMEAILREMARQ